VSDTDAFRKLRTVRAQRHCQTLSVGVLRADSLTHLIMLAELLVAGPIAMEASDGATEIPDMTSHAHPWDSTP
jgi:hypothetical protein